MHDRWTRVCLAYGVKDSFSACARWVSLVGRTVILVDVGRGGPVRVASGHARAPMRGCNDLLLLLRGRSMRLTRHLLRILLRIPVRAVPIRAAVHLAVDENGLHVHPRRAVDRPAVGRVRVRGRLDAREERCNRRVRVPVWRERVHRRVSCAGHRVSVRKRREACGGSRRRRALRLEGRRRERSTLVRELLRTRARVRALEETALIAQL